MAQHGIYDRSAILSEANRVLQGQEGFCYQMGNQNMLGIAFAQVQFGDYVFHPRPRNHSCDTAKELALVIRPYCDPTDAALELFRIVGACVHNYHGSLKTPAIWTYIGDGEWHHIFEPDEEPAVILL
jgi:hypothetical protein